MRFGWHRSILFRTALILVIVFVILGILTVSVSLDYNQTRAEQAVNLRLTQLLDTVESTASVACFTGDETLAAELAAGLLKNSEVLSVTIRAGQRELANRQRTPQADKTGAAYRQPPLVRDVFSPFSPDNRVGRILLTPDQAVIRKAVKVEARVATAQMAAQLVLVGLAVLAAVLLQIIRPITAISDGLHRMDAASGDRLPTPAGHRNSEIGRLVDDVNRLADRLVDTLEEERALRVQREIDDRRYHAIFQNAETGLFIIDSEGILRSWNPAFSRLTHLPQESGQLAELSLFGLAWVDPARLAEALLACISSNSAASAELNYRPYEDADHWLKVVLTPVGDHSVQGVVHDITEHKEAEQSARRLAITDNLTGVANRLGMEQRLQDLACGCDLKQTGGFALVLVDFDDFKRINEGFGLPIGDDILKETTQRLSSCIKSTDVVARFGADQFALALLNLNRGQDAERVAKRVFQALRQHFFVSGSPLRLSVSLGIAFYPQDTGTGIPGLLHHAELALGHAKASGGNAMLFFDPELAEAAERRRGLENDLRQAIRREEFVLYYQPIVDLQENRLVGAEALIRWRHPERGLVAPDDFIPLAEETGLISEIGLWALDVACQQLAEWQTQGSELSLSLNVSGRQIPEGLPPTVLVETVCRRAFAPSSLALEITEGVLLSDLSSTSNWLAAVREQGFPVYLDDFGTGYSSLSYLKRFAVDRLKVDKSFVRDIATNASDRTLVEAVVAMARSLSIEVVAEGVEDAAHMRLLRKMGCRYAQGYFFSRPVPIERFSDIALGIPDLMRSIGDEMPIAGAA